MQTETKPKTRKAYPIKQESIKKVCKALMEISYFDQEQVDSKYIRSICNANKVPLLMNAMLSLGYLKKVNFGVYQVMYTREIVNEKLAIKMYRTYNQVKQCAYKISTTKKSIEQVQQGSNEIKEQAIEKPESKNLLFAIVREEDILGAPMFDSIEQLQQNPPKGYGRYVVVSVGRSLEIKPQVILD